TPGLMLAEIVAPDDGNPGPTVASEGGLREAGAQEPEHTVEYVRIPSTADARAAERSRLGVGSVVFCADLIPGRPWVHLPVTMGYDRAPELLIDEKRAFLEDKLARGVRLFFTHDSGCALARVTRDEKGRFGTADEMPELSGMAA